LLDALTVFLALALVGFGLLVLQRRDFSASTLWTFAWVEMFVMASLLRVEPEKPWVEFTAFVLGTLFPALILAGTLSYAQRRVPPWLLPGALLLGALRGGLAASGSFTLGRSLALPLEPAAMLAAAWIAFGATRGGTSSLAQRLLPVAFVFLALVDAATAVSEIRLGEVTTVIVRIWYATGPLIIGIQILALSSLEQHELRRARDKLGQRIAERTANLRESEERFRRLAAMTLEGIALNEHGRIREVNPALCEMLGREHPELIGASLEQLFAVDESPGLTNLLQSRTQGCCEAQAVRADGTTFPVDVETREMRDRGRSLQVCSIRDIRERKEAERQRRDFERHMQEVQKLESLGVLAGGIAHDFNNLLTVILGNCRLELDELPADSPRRTWSGRC